VQLKTNTTNQYDTIWLILLQLEIKILQELGQLLRAN